MIYTNIKRKLFFLSIVLFGLYPLIPERQESFVPIIFIASSLLLFLSKPQFNFNWRPLIIMSSLFISFLISCFLSDNIPMGLKKIETMLSLIGLPIACFWFLRNTKLDFNRIERILFTTFFISNIAFCLVAMILFNFYRNPKFSSKDADFFRSAITDIPFIGDHSIYISLFLALAIIMGTFIYRRQNHKKSVKIGLLVGQLILGSTLLLLMSKGVIIALAIAFLGQYLLRQRFSKKIIIISVLAMFSVLILIPKQNNRFTELFNKESFNRLDLNNSTSIRYYILKCSINLVLDKPLFGHGLGDVQGQLDSCYQINEAKLPIGRYNSHNQYLFVWLSSGIFGLIIFLIYLGFIFNTAVKNRDYFLLNVLLLFVVTFLFENVLSRQSGVILFAFLVNLFTLKNLKTSDTM